MKEKCFLCGLLIVSSFFCHMAFSQKNKEKFPDSALEANSEKWKVKQHRGLFGFAKPEFGPYATIEAQKLDSAVIRKITKDSSETGGSISREGWDWDISKFETVEKKKFYRIRVTKDEDTAELLFSIYSVAVEKNQTILGKMLSKNDEDKNATLSYKKNIAGILVTRFNPTPFRFFIEDFLSTRQTSGNYAEGKAEITRGYVLTGEDSLFTEPIMQTIGNPKDKFFLEWQKGIFVNDGKSIHIAALKFGDGQLPFCIWMRKDLENAHQQAIASLFALLIAVMNL